MTISKCPACHDQKDPRRYLCEGCWWTLTRPTRNALLRKDDHAVRRLSNLLDQVRAGTPLHRIVIAV